MISKIRLHNKHISSFSKENSKENSKEKLLMKEIEDLKDRISNLENKFSYFDPYDINSTFREIKLDIDYLKSHI